MSPSDNLFRHPDPEHGSTLGDLACIAREGFKIFCIGATFIWAVPLLLLLAILLIY